MRIPKISDRAQDILKSLIQCYIRDGQPVGSKLLAEATSLRLSPATVRNVMADLEELGLIASPHTSAGRVPTAQGLRFFVDCLITVQPPTRQDIQEMQRRLNPDHPPETLANDMSNLLSQVTSMVSLVTVPRPDSNHLRHIEFLPLSERRVLVIVVLGERNVENRIIHTQRQYNQSELQQAANYINQHYAGSSVEKIRRELVEGMRSDKDRLDAMMQTLLDLAGGALDTNPPEPDYVLAGQSNLIDFAGPEDIGRLRELFDAFQQKQELLHLLDQCQDSDGVQLFIGEESGYQALGSMSVVTAPYEVEGRRVGVLGVIGPTRMHYERVIPLVDATSRLFSEVLNQ